MVSHLLYYQLALLALVWLFVMLHVAESHPGAPIPPTVTPIKPKRKRSNEPQPFHPTFKGVRYAAVNFAPVPPLDTRLDQCPRLRR